MRYILSYSLILFKSCLELFFNLLMSRERETLTCSIYLCPQWLIPVCALTGHQTRNLGISGRCSNQLSYLARTTY